MRSIQTRIMVLTVAAVLASVITVGTICFFSQRSVSDSHSTEVMRMICDERRVTINDYLSSIEHSQSIVTRFAYDELDTTELVLCGLNGADGWGLPAAQRGTDADRQRELDAYLRVYAKRVENVFRSAMDSTEGVAAYYFRINPEMSDNVPGFLFAGGSDGTLVRTAVTDLGLYDTDDMEHVGWYYEPLRRRAASWLEPYDNKNLGVTMISYVTPLYKEDMLIGVIGVDVSYQTLADLIRDIRLYESDYAYLAEADGTIIYHPTLPRGYLPETYVAGLTESFELMKTQDSNTEPVRYTMDGVERQLFFATIRSGQKLVVTAPLSEINAEWMLLAPKLIAAMLGVLLVFVAAASVIMHRIIQPLRRLTAAAQSIADGNYNVQLDYAGEDEVGMLTQAFEHLVNHLKVYINDLNSMAYRDALTGVKNKAAYNISAQKLNDMIRLGGAAEAPRFALAMFDCNELKKINDNYGHDKGDLYLQTACKLICDVFIHSPVFRVGGDEFAALLTDQSFDERDDLLRQFSERAAAWNLRADEPWKRVNIARGVADYDPAIDPDVEHVLQRADALMYENKRQSKAARQ